jgi:hypothetical protein
VTSGFTFEIQEPVQIGRILFRLMERRRTLFDSEVICDAPPLPHSCRLISAVLDWLRQCIRSRRDPGWGHNSGLGQLGRDRQCPEWDRRDGSSHIRDLASKRNIHHHRFLRRSDQLVPNEPDCIRQFQSWTTLRDRDHRRDCWLRWGAGFELL